jgi:hypothetical protein
LFSCKDRNEYRVDTEFTAYLQRFLDTAKVYNRTFDEKTNGLIIEFADLKDNTAGLTHYEDPIRIEIDQTYWNDISKTAGADMMKENLIFHELGHGLLKRGHLNSWLENGDWKSIMCGGDKVNDRPWNINYRGIRREYYISELFNENTNAPDFSTIDFTILTSLGIDTTGFSPSLNLNFNSEAQAGFKIVNNLDYQTTMDNGRLRFQSKVDQVFLIFAKTKVNTQYDFVYQLNIDYPTGDAANQYGLIYGTRPDSANLQLPESIEYFTVNNNQKMYMGNRTWYSYFTQLSEPQIIPSGRNTLKVMKINEMIYYFINNTYVYSSEIEAKKTGNYFGFMVPVKGVVWLENLTISDKNKTKISSRIKQSQSIEFEFYKVNELNQRNIKNK